MSSSPQAVTIEYAKDLAVPFLDAYINTPDEHKGLAVTLFLCMLTTLLSRGNDMDAASIMHGISEDVEKTLEKNCDMLQMAFNLPERMDG